MASFLELQNRVKSNIIDLPTEVANAVPQLINDAISNLQQKHDFKVQEVLGGPYTTAAVTRILAATPSDFLKPRGAPYIVDALGRVEFMGWAANRLAVSVEFGSDLGGEADPVSLSGRPKQILQSEPTNVQGSTNLEVWPFSDSRSDYVNGQYRIVIPYWRTLATLSNPGDTNWFTINAAWWLECEATSMGFFKDWDEQRGTLWKQRAAEALGDVIRLDKKYRLGSVHTLVPNMDVFEARLLK